MTHAIQPQPGNQTLTRREDLVGRDGWLAEALDRLDRRTGLRVTGPRRIGKSWTVQALAMDIERNRPTWHVSYESYQGVQDESRFARTVIAEVLTTLPSTDRAREKFRNVLSGTTVEATGPLFQAAIKFQAEHKDRPLEGLHNVLQTAAQHLAEKDGRLVLILDEFPLMLQRLADRGPDGVTEAIAIVHAVRAWSDIAGVHVVLTGSVGLHHIMRRLGLGEGDINHLNATAVRPISPDACRELASGLLSGSLVAGTYGDDAVDKLAELTHGIALFGHKVAERLRDSQRPLKTADPDNLPTVTAGDVEHAWDNLVDEGIGLVAFEHNVTRLAEYGDHAELARTILDDLLDDGEGRTPEQVAAERAPDDTDIDDVRTVLTWLRKDEYLTRTRDGRYAWAHDGLQLLWRLQAPQLPQPRRPGAA